MTNGWVDIKNTDAMLIMGGNPAENHPCGFKWPIEAKLRRNAKMIVVDPRFTRTAATADLFLQIRAGSDIAFLGGLINYAIQNKRIAKDYLINFTNAALYQEGFKLPEDGLFSGFDAAEAVYDPETWNYEQGGNFEGQKGRDRPDRIGCRWTIDPSEKGQSSAGGSHEQPTGRRTPGCRSNRRRRLQGGPKQPPPMPQMRLTTFRCNMNVPSFQLLKKQYTRYTPEMVERITGIPKDRFEKRRTCSLRFAKMAT